MYGGYSPARAAVRAEEARTFGTTLTEEELRVRHAIRDAEFEKTCPPSGLARLTAKLRYYFGASNVRLPVPPQFDIARPS